MYLKRNVLSLFVISALSFTANAEVDISGFGSVTAVQILSGNGVPHYGIDEAKFLASYPTVSVYTEYFTFKPETKFGLQFNAELGDGFSATAQLVARGANDFDVDFE